MSVLEARDEADAQEQLYQLGCTDGLPVIIPTEARVDRMVLASGTGRFSGARRYGAAEKPPASRPQPPPR